MRRILAAIWRFLRALLGLPGELLRDLTGRNGSPIPPSAAFEDVADDHAGQLRQELGTTYRRESGIAATTLGGLVHGYAAGDREVRDRFDVGKLPEHVAVALLTMKDGDMMKLSGATPEACGKWALGQRSGIVGIPDCREDWLPAVISGKKPGGEQAAVLVPAGEKPFDRQLRLVV